MYHKSKLSPNSTGIKFWFWSFVEGILLILHIAYIYLEALSKLIFPKRFKSLEGEVILVSLILKIYVFFYDFTAYFYLLIFIHSFLFL